MRSSSHWRDASTMAMHIYGYVESGETNEAHKVVDRHRYKLEYLGQTLSGGWTVVRITEEFPKNDTTFIDLLKESLFHLIAHMQVSNQALLDSPVDMWYFDTKKRYHDARIKFTNMGIAETTIEGKAH